MVPTSFQPTEEDIYDGVDMEAPSGFSSHDQTARKGELAKVTEELYEAQGKTATLQRDARPPVPNTTPQSRQALPMPDDLYEEMPSVAPPPRPQGKKKAPAHWSQSTANWLHGQIDRRTAEQLLYNAGAKAGTFLVRTRAQAGQYTLSLQVSAQTAEHHILAKDASGSFTVTNQPLPKMCASLEDVIHLLSHESNSAISVKLQHPVAP